ncbi:MAG: non-heme iron oxygenase ferredoxin subunit [Actinomycetota bacterium]|nr:non-heme iron oxygenase ferredoxin subunit [Actinomycetota bacterium]
MTETVLVAPLAQFPEGSGLRVEVAEHRIAMFRIGDTVYAVGDRCSHAEASLAEGEVFDTEVECPRHGSTFNLMTGEPQSLPATRPVPVYLTEVVDGDVYLTIDTAVDEVAS